VGATCVKTSARLETDKKKGLTGLHGHWEPRSVAQRWSKIMCRARGAALPTTCNWATREESKLLRDSRVLGEDVGNKEAF